jgi:hypothetical protein
MTTLPAATTPTPATETWAAALPESASGNAASGDVNGPGGGGAFDSVEDLAALFPDRLPMVRHLDPAAALAFRTPLQEHVQSADGKAAGIVTLLGLMCTVLTRFGGTLGEILRHGAWLKAACVALLVVFVGAAMGTVLQAFRTIAPRFPKGPPSLAFFGDIAGLSREQYLERVMSLSPETALGHMLSYNHTAATICVNKQRQLQFGLRLFRAASVCWVLLALVLAYEGLR